MFSCKLHPDSLSKQVLHNMDTWVLCHSFLWGPFSRVSLLSFLECLLFLSQGHCLYLIILKDHILYSVFALNSSLFFSFLSQSAKLNMIFFLSFFIYVCIPNPEKKHTERYSIFWFCLFILLLSCPISFLKFPRNQCLWPLYYKTLLNLCCNLTQLYLFRQMECN